MKILLVTATYPPSVNGVAISVESLFINLKSMGHDVYVLAPKNENRRPIGLGEVRYPSIPNPIVKDYPIPLLPITPKIINLLTKKKFDIVHAHHPFYISFFADIVSTFNNIPLVFTYHTRYDEYAKTSLKFLPKSISKKLTDYTTLRVCKKSDGVIAPSKTIKRYLLDKNINTKVMTIPTGLVDLEKIRISKSDLRTSLSLPKNRHLLLCVSRIAEEKNIRLLLEIICVLPDEYFLILVGTGPQENELKHLSRELKIDSRIKFVGKVEHKEVSKYYSVADCFIFPSTTETQGIALLEAAYFNLPCVAVDSKVNREWTVRKASFISKSTVSAFENAILKCRSLDKAIVKEKTDEFAKKYTAERTARMTLGFYDELIEEETRKKNFKNRLATKLNSLEKYIDRIIE